MVTSVPRPLAPAGSRGRALLAGAAALLLAAPAPGYETIPVAGGGRVSGRITVTAVPKPAPALEVDKNGETCGRAVPDETLLVSADGGVANAVIRIEGVVRGKAIPTTPTTLDNSGCRFQPHVLAMTVGQVLRIRNSDPILHNTHATFGEDETAFNLALPIQGQELLQKMKRKGIFRIRCDAGHGWMSAVLVVEEHPYLAVSDARGEFDIRDLPPGSYRIRVWHETLGERSGEVQVPLDGAVRTDFRYPLP